MSHITCPKCGGNEHVVGYGFAAGVFGSYTLCECGVVLELSPDTEGLSNQEAADAEARAVRALAGEELDPLCVVIAADPEGTP